MLERMTGIEPALSAWESVPSTLDNSLDLLFYGSVSDREYPATGTNPDCNRTAYDLGSTTLVTTQRCLPIWRSRMNPSFS